MKNAPFLLSYLTPQQGESLHTLVVKHPDSSGSEPISSDRLWIGYVVFGHLINPFTFQCFLFLKRGHI